MFQQQMEALHRAYVKQLPDKIQQIEDLWKTACAGTPDKGALQLLYHLVHKLNGSGPIFGFTAITERAGRLEEAIKKILVHGVSPTPEEKRQVDQAVASLRLIAAAAVAERPGFGTHNTATNDLAASRSNGVSAEGRRYTILVADDEAFLRKKLVLILREAGFDVEEAENGQAALTQARIKQPDLILMDFLMPVMDGAEAVRQLRRDEGLHAVPVLLLTTHQKISDVQRALDCNVQGYLAKPFDVLEVIDQINAYLADAAVPSGDGAPAMPSKHILIADDYSLYRKQVALILQDAGFNVAEADNGMMALKQARERQPDLILMDVMMPVMDGLEATHQIRKDDALQHVPIIMLTTNVKMKDVPLALAHGADAYIAKPQTAEKLIEKVKSCLV